MITYKDIKLAINSIILDNFIDIPIQSKDISEGFERPSFFVEFDNIKSNDMMNYFKSRNISIIIYYFPSNLYQNSLEILEIQEKLEYYFLGQVIDVNDTCFITVNDMEFEIIDGVLEASFDIEFMVEYDEHKEQGSKENMEELNINMECD